MRKNGILLIILLITGQGFCDQPFYKTHARGWHWYEQKQKDEEIASPTEQVESLRQDTESKLHKALLYPTTENVSAYIKAQEKVANKSEAFSNVWQKVIYTNPELDRTLQHPVSNNALHIARAEDLTQKRQKIRSLSKEYGLMYFFRGDCKYCQGFSSVVQNFAKFYNWTVMPIQIGGIASAEFPNAKKNNGIAENLGISKVPALIAVHPKTRKIVPLAFGYISESEIEDRVNVLT